MTIFRVNLDNIGSPPFIPKTQKCIVLDLDETLVHTFIKPEPVKRLRINKRDDDDPLKERMFVIGETEEWGAMISFKRPHLDEFLIFAFTYFDIVAVWSAGKPQYVEAVCREIFKDIRPPGVIFTSENCHTDEEGLMTKPLEHMLDEMHQDERLRYRMRVDNTFFVDDRETSFSHNQENGILIPPYNPDSTIEQLEKDDTTLVHLAKWFMIPEVVKERDIRNIDLTKIFPPRRFLTKKI